MALALGVSLAHADPSAIDLAARVEPSSVLVGEPVRYVITVTRPARLRAELPAVRGNTGRFDVDGYRVSADTLPDGRVRETHALDLVAWTPGDDTLPSQRVELRDGSDTAATVLYTPPTAVAIRATAPRDGMGGNDGKGGKDAKDIADIRDSERLPGTFPWGVPLLLAAVAAAWYAVRRRARRPKPVQTAAARVATAEETALARLRGLEEASPPPREFAFALSEILRAWLADRFGVDALEATTEELLERVKPLPLHEGREAWLRELCEALDRVKFADATLADADKARQVDDVRGFVGEGAARAETSSPPPAALSDASPDAGRPA